MAGLAVAMAGVAMADGDAAAAREWPYRIAAGDTLIGLSALYLQRPGDWPALQRHNRIADARRLVPGSTLRFPFEWLKREAAMAEVVYVQGRVELLRAGAAPVPLSSTGEVLRSADAVRTGPGSSVSLRFADGSRLLVVPDSQVTMERLLVLGRSGITDTALRVDRGGADTRVVPNATRTPGFEVRTPTIHLGVRGTDFRVGVDASGEAARVEVLSGGVAAGAASTEAPPVLVGGGQGTRARATAPVEPPRPLLPAPAVGAGPLRLERLPFGLDWSAVAGASAYRVQVFPEDRPDALLLDGRFDAPPARWDAAAAAALPDGRYRWRVRALDGDGLEGLNGEGRFELAARPFAPPVAQPAPGAVQVAGRVVLRWTPAPASAAPRYRVQLSGDGDFASPLHDRTVSGTEAAFELAPGVYHWRVAGLPAADGPARGPFGEAQAFELRAPPAPPVLESPQFAPDNVLLRWATPAPGHGVQVQLARDAGFADRLVDRRTWGGQLQFARPPAGSYHLRLRSIVGDTVVEGADVVRTLEVPPLPWWESFGRSAPAAR